MNNIENIEVNASTNRKISLGDGQYVSIEHESGSSKVTLTINTLEGVASVPISLPNLQTVVTAISALADTFAPLESDPGQ